MSARQGFMRDKLIDQHVEALCRKGCRSVREDIRLLTQGVIPPELKGLDDLAGRAVVKELRAIMAVYGDGCPVIQQRERKKSDLQHGQEKKKTSR
ncbi:MAG: hypothetical protein KZQ76_12200 [Candidatus Thiodiazotropha sp. (ex Epidulcina cf. delphinae)]|nr:hypothetical protein [Candidatus Thiodiazotropha sp. (ex Epidulcina cf. delphinae)]